MDITQRKVEGVTVVQLSGRLDSAVAGKVMDQLNQIVTSGSTRLVINLRDVPYISSAGLRSFLVASKLAQSSGGEIRLCEAGTLVERILSESGFSNLIRLDGDEGMALAALRQR